MAVTLTAQLAGIVAAAKQPAADLTQLTAQLAALRQQVPWPLV